MAQSWPETAPTEVRLAAGAAELAAALDSRLADDRLTATLRVRNAGTEPAPVGAGFHPYLTVGAERDGDLADAELHLPARTRLVLDGGLPTGERRPVDGAIGRIG